MARTGSSLSLQAGMRPSEGKVTNAIVTDTRAAIEYDHGQPGSLLATSQDGIEYRGTYGHGSELDPKCTVEFTRYTALDGRVALVGSWNNANAGGGDGEWLIEIGPPEN